MDEEDDQLYFLADNIYPEFPIFMQSYGESSDEKIHHYSKRLEGVRKDVERTFGVLQARFAFLTKPCLLWYVEDITNAVMCCLTLHNMIVEEEFEYSDRVNVSLRSSEYLPKLRDINRNFNDFNVDRLYIDNYLVNIRQAQSYNKFLTMRERLVQHLYRFRNVSLSPE